MNKKIAFSILLITISIIITGCNSNNNISNNQIESNNLNNQNEVTNSVRVSIDGKDYTINLENNETTKSFVNMLPLELTMNELNGNEKYVYIDTILPVKEYNPKIINAGDVMLYGNNCLVIFYKTFETSYSYTKIGHIDNLDNLGNGNINIKFEK